MCPPDAPEYGGLKVESQQYPDARLNPDAASLANFGGGEATQAAFGASSDVAKQAGDVAQEAQSRADQVAHLAADNQIAQKQAEIQSNISRMHGQNSLQAHDYVKSQWEQLSQSMIEGTQNRAQQMAVIGSISSRGQELYRFAENHVSQQMESFADEQSKAGVQNAVNLAAMNPYDSDTISTQRARAEAVIQDQAQRKGIYLGPDGKPTATYQAMKADALGGFDKTMIQAMLDKDEPQGISAAKEYLDSHKDGMQANEMLAARKLVENSETKQMGMEAWNQLQGMKLPDGTPDTGRMESSIMARDDLTDQRKLQVIQFVKARAGEERVQWNQHQMANDRSFMNDLVNARRQGTPMEQAMNLVRKYSIDDYDSAIKTAAVQKTYAPPSDSDAQAVVNLRERIESGQATRSDVDGALQNNAINTSDWKTLRNQLFSANVEGRTPQMKLVNSQVNALARQTFGADTTKRNVFLNAVNDQTMGMSPQEKFKAASDMLKTDPSTQNHFLWMPSLPFGGKSQWETSAQSQQATTLAWGQAYQDLGRDQTLAIGQGVMHQGGKGFHPADVDAFADHFGGYQNLKQGTPVNNAIQSLSQKGQLVTPANVRWVLDRAKDGKL